MSNAIPLTFDRYLKAGSISNQQAAAALGCSGEYIRLLRIGLRRPRPPLAARIETWSGGQVTAMSLLFPDRSEEP